MRILSIVALSLALAAPAFACDMDHKADKAEYNAKSSMTTAKAKAVKAAKAAKPVAQSKAKSQKG